GLSASGLMFWVDFNHSSNGPSSAMPSGQARDKRRHAGKHEGDDRCEYSASERNRKRPDHAAQCDGQPEAKYVAPVEQYPDPERQPDNEHDAVEDAITSAKATRRQHGSSSFRTCASTTVAPSPACAPVPGRRRRSGG